MDARGKSAPSMRLPAALAAEVAEAAERRGLDPAELLTMMVRSALDALPVVGQRRVDDGRSTCRCGNHGRGS